MQEPQSSHKSFPSIFQSLGISAILIATMLLLSPLHLVLASPLGHEASTFIYYLLAMGVSLTLVNKLREKVSGNKSFVVTMQNPRILLLCVPATIALLFGILVPIGALIPMPETFKEAFRALAGQTGVLAFLTMVVAAPILEELFFRGIMLDGLLKRYTPQVSILLSSALFGFVHLNPWQFVAGLGIGIFSGWIYYKTKNLMPSIAIHAAANFSGFCSRFYSNIDDLLDDTIFDMYGNITNLVLAVTGSLAVIWVCVSLLKREFRKEYYRRAV